MWELTSSQFFNLLSVKMIRKCTSAGEDRGKKRKKKADWFVQSLRACESKNVFVTGTAPSPRRLGKTRDICRPPEIDVTAEAPETDRLRHREPSRELGDYRPYADCVNESDVPSPDS